MNKIYKFTGIILMLIAGLSCNGTAANSNKNKNDDPHFIELTAEEFKEKVYDWENGGEWKYLGDKPAIIDFYAVWCGPCRLLKPRLKAIAKEYDGEIVVYSIDAESAPRLSMLMGIQAYPTLFFVPKEGIPTKSEGLLKMKDLRRGVDELLLKKTSDQ